MNSKFARGQVLATLTVGAALAAAAAPPFGHPVKVVSGETTLTLSTAAKKATGKDDVKVTGTTLAVAGGDYSFHALNDGGGGTLTHKGALRFARGSTAVKFSKPQLEVTSATARRKATGKLTGVVDGKRIAIGKAELARYETTEEPRGFLNLKLVLSKPAAKALNRKFDTTAFKVAGFEANGGGR